jgi:predicted ATPase
MKWNDVTSYSHSSSERIPRDWMANVGQIVVHVHRHIHYKPDVWLVSTIPHILEMEQLASPNIDEAKCQALAKLQAACEDIIRAIVCNKS